MSSRNTNKQSIKPFCKVCYDAGKTEKEYTSHYVKTEAGPNGKVACPTLLSQKCTYCAGSGHTAGYCKVIADKKKAETKALKQAEHNKNIVAEKASEKKRKPANLFEELLDDESDNEVAVKKVMKSVSVPVKAVQEDFPALCSSGLKRTTVSTSTVSYASALAKEPEVVETNKIPITFTMSKQIKPKAELTVVLPKPVLRREKADRNVYNNNNYDDNDADYMAFVYQPSALKASEMDWAALDSDESDDEY
jgi:predicted transcriptional regulator